MGEPKTTKESMSGLHLIFTSHYTWRVIATNYLWFLEFITSFVYPMINTLVFS